MCEYPVEIAVKLPQLPDTIVAVLVGVRDWVGVLVRVGVRVTVAVRVGVLVTVLVGVGVTQPETSVGTFRLTTSHTPSWLEVFKPQQ